jgi:hypothetical protein
MHLVASTDSFSGPYIRWSDCWYYLKREQHHHFETVDGRDFRMVTNAIVLIAIFKNKLD